MKYSSALLGLSLACIVFAGAWYLAKQDKIEQPQPKVYESWISDVIDHKNELENIQVYDKNNSLIINAQQQNGQWVAANLADFPLNNEVVTAWCERLFKSQNIEAKTKNPNNFYRLALVDASRETEVIPVSTTLLHNAHLIELTADKTYQLLIGKEASSTHGQYVRLKQSNQTWLIDTVLDIPTKVTDWINTALFNWSIEQIEMVSINRITAKEQWKIIRQHLLDQQAESQNDIEHDSENANSDANNQADRPAKQENSTNKAWLLAPMSADSDLAYPGVLEAFLNEITQLTFETVSELDPVLWQLDSQLLIQVGLTDDSLITLDLLANQEQYWLRLMAEGSGLQTDTIGKLQKWQFKLSKKQFDKLNRAYSSLIKTQNIDKTIEP